MKTALIIGASGQAALTLARQLITNYNYKIYATERRCAKPQSRHVLQLLKDFPDNYFLLNADLTDTPSIINAIRVAQPQEFYNLAAFSHVGKSFQEPVSVGLITGMGVTNCLEAIRQTDKTIKFLTASSSEMFGGLTANDGELIEDVKTLKNVKYILANEKTKLWPKSPYGAAKCYAHYMTRIYRESYGMYAATFIAFNYEGPLRKPEFVTRKVTIAATEIFLKKRKTLELGSLNFGRDWSFCPDIMDGAYRILQQDKPSDYILATGKIHTAEDLLEAAFGKYSMDWRKYVVINSEFSRPNDVILLCGDASKAYKELGFRHTKSFNQMIDEMMNNDYNIFCKYGEILE